MWEDVGGEQRACCVRLQAGSGWQSVHIGCECHGAASLPSPLTEAPVPAPHAGKPRGTQRVPPCP